MIELWCWCELAQCGQPDGGTLCLRSVHPLPQGLCAQCLGSGYILVASTSVPNEIDAEVQYGQAARMWPMGQLRATKKFHDHVHRKYRLVSILLQYHSVLWALIRVAVSAQILRHQSEAN